MSKRERPGRRERKGRETIQKESLTNSQTPQNNEETAGFIYPDISEELKALYESIPAYHLDALPIIYHTAQHQDDINEALERLILLTQEIYRDTDKELEVRRNIENKRSVVTYLGLKPRDNENSSEKESNMTAQKQTLVEATDSEQPMKQEQQEVTTVIELKNEVITEENPGKTAFDELWDKMAAACEKDGLPDMNLVEYTDSSILNQINNLILGGDPKGRHFARGEHRMANIIATISDPALVNMIPYIHHVGAMTDPEYYDKDYTKATLRYDFGKYGVITFIAEQYDPLRHPSHFSSYASVMRLVKEGEMADNLLTKPEHKPSFISDHRVYAAIINRVHLAHWAFKYVMNQEKQTAEQPK